ncbi:MAG TPA: bifunctional methylenetetrahydrofolate dehydrogenase/methenyltetrahydrofolate cyclohydrolase FolD [Chromatiales bacterium]|nr:bifunctional methylenetetrahydrofolate dehydrogenase/methenyltetrahydrofolate cyclohydrolase FolD [Chromatiales bacterium]
MTARIIDGRAIAAQVLEEVRKGVSELRAAGLVPRLATVLVGEDPASRAYVGNKRRTCEQVGIESVHHQLPASTPGEALLELVRELNEDPGIHGILVQLPLPRGLDTQAVIEAIDPAKDVDGFHPVNLGRLVAGLETFVSCTPAGILELIHRSGFETRGRHVVIVGRSNIVGKPLMNLLVQKSPTADATVTVCHSGTRDLAEHTRRADILVAAVGRPHLIGADMVRSGAVVVDVGINRVADAQAPRGHRLVGDVDFEAVRRRAAAITPVPGGVGPMTVAMLMVNTLKAARRAAGL